MAEIENYKSNTLISGTRGNDSIENGGWLDGSWYDVSSVTINTGDGNDSVLNRSGSTVTIYTGAGNDYVYNNENSSVTINTGAGSDSVWNWGDSVTINTGEGYDYVQNDKGSSVTINTGAGNDSVENWGNSVTINTGSGNDSVWNYDDLVTITGGNGNDSIYNSGYLGDDGIYYQHYYHGRNVLFKYSSGDGNDIIYGFKADSTLSISGSSYSSKKSGDDIIVTVGTGKISLMGAASLDKVNIKGTKTSSSSNNIFSKVNVTDFGGESRESVRTKAIAGLETLLKTDMSDVVLKNVDGLKTLDDPTRKKLSSLASIFKLAGEANSGFSAVGNLFASAETFLGLVQSKKRDANWGKQFSDCVKNLLKCGNSVLKLSDKKLAKSLGLGLGGSLFGLIGSVVATTDGITDKERDNIVKDVFSVGGEFAKLIIPTAKATSMEINLVTATASALYMGSVQMQKSLEKYYADGSLTLTDFRDAKIDSVMVSLDEFARKMTLGTSDVFFNWLDKKLGGSPYDNMTYIEKAAEGYKLLFNYIGDQSVKLAKNIGSAIGNWWTKITDSFNQNGVNLKGDSKNNVILGGAKKDTLSGGSGDDKLFGNAGDDSLNGGDGKDTLSGGTDNDKLLGGAGNDSLSGGDGKDTLSGGSGNDKLLGGSGNDCIKGGTGRDSLIGGKGNDKLWGDDGKDIFYYAKGDGKDIIYGFEDGDTLTLDNLKFTASYDKSSDAITFNVNGGSVTLKEFTATTFSVNNATYKISGSQLVKS